MNAIRQLNDGEQIDGTPYRVMRWIGCGGMGSVYEVEHVELGKRFVLKALLSDLSLRPDLVARMRNEWRSLGRLDHPNIVRVTDAGIASGNMPFLVMERLFGESLAETLSRRGALELAEALGIGAHVLAALAAAHEVGIVHRDVKPANIFLTEHGEVKLLDFGIAKLLDASAEAITARGVAIGTPRYMSPEQAAGEPIDARADLYAAGLVLYEMLTGAALAKRTQGKPPCSAQLNQTATLLSQRLRGASPVLGALLQSLLATSPARRPKSAAAAAAVLGSVIAERRTATNAAQGTSALLAVGGSSTLSPAADFAEMAGRWSRRVVCNASIATAARGGASVASCCGPWSDGNFRLGARASAARKGVARELDANCETELEWVAACAKPSGLVSSDAPVVNNKSAFGVTTRTFIPRRLAWRSCVAAAVTRLLPRRWHPLLPLLLAVGLLALALPNPTTPPARRSLATPQPALQRTEPDAAHSSSEVISGPGQQPPNYGAGHAGAADQLPSSERWSARSASGLIKH